MIIGASSMNKFKKGDTITLCTNLNKDPYHRFKILHINNYYHVNHKDFPVAQLWSIGLTDELYRLVNTINYNDYWAKLNA